MERKQYPGCCLAVVLVAWVLAVVGTFRMWWEFEPAFAVAWLVFWGLVGAGRLAREPLREWWNRKMAERRAMGNECVKCGSNVPYDAAMCPRCGAGFSRTWRSIAAGAITMIGGCLMVPLVLASVSGARDSSDDRGVALFMWVLAAVFAILGLLAVAGGYFALRRRKWGWALAGAIATVLPFFPLSVTSIILLAFSKGEFGKLRPYSGPALAVESAPKPIGPPELVMSSGPQTDVVDGGRLCDEPSFSMWMPDSVVGGNPGRDLATLGRRVQELGPAWVKWFNQWSGRAAAVTKDPLAAAVPFVGFDAGASGPERASTFVVNLIYKEAVHRPRLTLREHTEHMVGKIRSRACVDQVEYITLKGMPASRVVWHGKADIRGGIREACWLYYIIVTDKAAWNLSWMMPADEVDRRRPMLERCVATFRIKSEAPSAT